jgi:hypothetical protein
MKIIYSTFNQLNIMGLIEEDKILTALSKALELIDEEEANVGASLHLKATEAATSAAISCRTLGLEVGNRPERPEINPEPPTEPTPKKK